MVNIKDLERALPSISDWEDSYLADGSQRLMGKSDNIQCEVILAHQAKSVSCFFASVDQEVVNLVSLATGSQTDSLGYFQRAATFVSSNPNTPYQEKFGDYSLGLTQIKTSDGTVNTLTIERN